MRVWMCLCAIYIAPEEPQQRALHFTNCLPTLWQWRSFRFKCVCATPFNHCGLASKHDLKFGQLLVCLLALDLIQMLRDKRWQPTTHHIQACTTHFTRFCGLTRFYSIQMQNVRQRNGVSWIFLVRSWAFWIFIKWHRIFNDGFISANSVQCSAHG